MSIISAGEEFKKARPPQEKKDVEHPRLTTTVLAHAAKIDRTFCSPNWLKYALQPFAGISFFAQVISSPLALSAGAGEMFVQRLSKKVGISIPTVTLIQEEPADFENYYVRKVIGGWSLSSRIPKSLPLYFIKDQPGISTRDMNSEVLRTFFVELLDKRCPVGRNAYSDFPSECESSPTVLEAGNWRGPQKLLGHAFRHFLNATYGHLSNVLVAENGQLHHIDFEKIIFRPDTEDIDMLSDWIADSRSVRAACNQISTLTTRDIKQALNQIPEAFWPGGEFDTTEDAAAYFSNRLKVWKRHFKPKVKTAAAR